MSLLSAIAYDGTHETREIPYKGIGAAVAALVLGAAIGFVIGDNPPAVDVPVAAATGMALDDFIRLNTTSYEGLAPVTATVATPQTATNSFLNMNVTSYDGLVPSAVAETHKTVDPSFLYWNIEAFNNLSPVEPSAVLRSVTTADGNLWAINVTSFGHEAYQYAEQPSGPR